MHAATALLMSEECDALSQDIRQVVSWFRENDPDRGCDRTRCYFFNIATRRCLIHECKPEVCRDFEPGGGDCHRLCEAYLIVIEMLNQILNPE